jgi:CXXC-20-CXXC protein
MKIRSCPNCGYRQPYAHYIKNTFFQLKPAGLTCKECGSKLFVSGKRRFLVVIIGMLPILLSAEIRAFFTDMGYSKAASIAGFMVIFLSWSMLIYGFDTFKLKEKSAA